MMRMNFLYLGAMVTVAAWLQGNQLATWLAFAAFVLTFIAIEITPSNKGGKRPLFSLSARSAERKKGPSKTGRTNRMLAYMKPRRNMMPKVAGDMKEDMGQLAEQLHEEVGKVIHSASQYAHKNISKNMADGIYLHLSGCLGALHHAAPLVAKQPEFKSREEFEAFEAIELVQPETIVFAGLVASRMHLFARADGDVGIEYGPRIFALALKDWQQVFADKDPKEYLHNAVVEAALEYLKDHKPRQLEQIESVH